MNHGIPLFPKQRWAVDALGDLEGVALLAGGMGAGKSRMSMANMVETDTSQVLIVAPLSVVRVWEKELPSILPPDALDIFCAPLHGTIKEQAVALREWSKPRNQRGDLRIGLVHYDVYWREPLRTAIERWAPKGLILDEAQRIKHRGSRRARFAHALARRSWQRYGHRLALSGTPTSARLAKLFDPKSKLANLFSLMKFVGAPGQGGDGSVLGTEWQAFEDEFITLKHIPGIAVPIVEGYKNIDTLQQKVYPQIVIVHREDVIELPPALDIPVPVPLTPKTRRAYDELKRDSITRVAGLDALTGVATTATVVSSIALTEATKLQQIACGSVIVGQKPNQQVVDIGSEKINACLDLLTDAIDETNVIIGCRFRRDMRRLEAAISTIKHDNAPRGKIRVATVAGDQTKRQRDAALDLFDQMDYTVLICQIQAGALGLNLAKANVMILFSTDYDTEAFVQFHDRMHRPGQTRRCLYYHLLGENTVDESVYQALLQGIDLPQAARSVAFAKQLLTGE